MIKILLALLLANTLWGAYSRDDAAQAVYDDQTNLTWQDDGNVTRQKLIWSNAVAYCENLTFAGADDWRLPSANELISIVDNTRRNPAMDPVFKNRVNHNVWSSTTDSGYDVSAWVVIFDMGYFFTLGKTDDTFVRCVRTGKITSLPTTPKQTLNIKEGWQLLGATQDINATAFNNTCVDFVWAYNNAWAVHVANGQSITLPSNINTLTTIQTGKGFWVKGNGTCAVE